MLDSFTNAKGKQRIENLIENKIIKNSKIRFFDEFVSTGQKKATIEDNFNKEDYLKIFNGAFADYPDITINDLDTKIPNIIE